MSARFPSFDDCSFSISYSSGVTGVEALSLLLVPFPSNFLVGVDRDMPLGDALLALLGVPGDAASTDFFTITGGDFGGILDAGDFLPTTRLGGPIPMVVGILGGGVRRIVDDPAIGRRLLGTAPGLAFS